RHPGEDLLLGGGALGPVVGHERDGPVDQRRELVLEAGEVDQVDAEPHQPRDEPAQPDLADQGDRVEAGDGRHRALVEV
ncbi:hypothetical protein CWM41_28725, partial [Escherichia coli]